ncbi:DUF2273 domain-containing protein [Tomitella gaofuii]|uniref:DUF2273 domain-containing protein n=1 Tax=Tomitella gaofuii TaxID=2760083 RepID=UPI0015FA5AA4|nr:DUF2273 domain-containing protein [Tomitella gaofuii]
MKLSTIGLIAGLLLAIAAATGGWWAFLLAIVLGALGGIIGAHFDGDVDLSAITRGRGRG